MLNHQMPVLVSFVFLRVVGIFTVSKMLYAITPQRVRPYTEMAGDWFMRFRRVAMSAGLASLIIQTLYAPPDGVCAEYKAVKAQGISALISLCVLMTTNHILASAVAIGALRAVASTSASSLVLSTSAAVISSSGVDTALFTYCLFWVALGHATFCYSDTDSKSTTTHGSIIAALAIIFYALFYLSGLFCQRVYNIIRGMFSRTRRLALTAKPHAE